MTTNKLATPASARGFIDAAAIPDPPAPRSRESADASANVMAALDTTRQQATAVGSDVIAFAEGVPGKFRQDVVNSTLLAQLVATKKVSDRTRIFDWYDAYFDALANIGWAVQARNFDIYVETGENFEANKAIIAIMTALLGPGATTLTMITGTLQALQSMDTDSPWITLFSRETMTADGASFQISAVEKGPDGEPFVALAAFTLHASKTIKQVLVFKAKKSDVTLRRCSTKISINAAVADAVRQQLSDKLAAHAVDYVKSIGEF